MLNKKDITMSKTNYAEMITEFQNKFDHKEAPVDAAYIDFRLSLIREEFKELVEAHDKQNPVDVVDALIDLIYVSIGYLTVFDIDADVAFKAVHDANMSKNVGQRGRRTIEHSTDVVKPDGWQAPEKKIAKLFLGCKTRAHRWHAEIKQYKPKADKTHEVELFTEAARVLKQKTIDYNGPGAPLDDARVQFFPYDEYSYMTFINTKVQRLDSLLKNSEKNIGPVHEGVEDSLIDLVNYASFYYRFLKDYKNDDGTTKDF